jgi:hypothetical protein
MYKPTSFADAYLKSFDLSLISQSVTGIYSVEADEEASRFAKYIEALPITVGVDHRAQGMQGTLWVSKNLGLKVIAQLNAGLMYDRPAIPQTTFWRCMTPQWADRAFGNCRILGQFASVLMVSGPSDWPDNDSMTVAMLVPNDLDADELTEFVNSCLPHVQ